MFTTTQRKTSDAKRDVEAMLNKFRINFSEVILVDDLFTEPQKAT